MLVLVFVFVLVLVVVIRLVVVVGAVLVFVVLLHLLHLFQSVQVRGLGEPGDVVVVRIAGETVEVPRQVAAAAVQPEGPVPAVAVVGAAQVEDAADPLRHFARDTSRVDIDHAADGAGAVEQGRRTLQDLHALGDEGVDRDRVVAAADGNVERVDAVLHDAHARAAETVDDGAPRARAVGTVVDARLVAHGGADVVHRLAFELVGVQHVAGLREPFVRQRVCQDEDLFDGTRLFLRRSFSGERDRPQPRHHTQQK